MVIGAVAGLAAAVGTAIIPDLRVWHLTNTDTGETSDGDFEATDVKREISTNYAELRSLGQAKPLTQWLNGNLDRVSFRVRMYQSHILDNLEARFEKIVSWVRKDPKLLRPPIVLFYVGDGSPMYGDHFSVIESISDVQFDSPTIIGSVRGVAFTLSLKEYVEYSLENIPPPESRYAHAQEGDYMELLAWQEYGDPLLGDVIRKRHPDLDNDLDTGDVVKLPSLEAIKKSTIEPKSIALKTSLGRKATPQKALAEFHFARTNRPYYSTIVPRGI
jgi:hypothetical protein